MSKDNLLEQKCNAVLQESDREKLHLARQRHAIEEQQADSDALKEQRKEERAAKRAARKEAASQQVEEVTAAAPTSALKNISRSKVTAGSTSASRCVNTATPSGAEVRDSLSAIARDAKARCLVTEVQRPMMPIPRTCLF